MEINREDINALNAEVKIKLTEKDYRPKVDSVLQDYQKKSRLKGFRPGKVPMGMIKKNQARHSVVAGTPVRKIR